jgi:hypothetical protein
MVAVVVLLALAGCGSKDPAPAAPQSTASAKPSVSSSASPAPSTSGGTLVEFSVDGAGPYEIGATLDALKTKPGLTEVTPGAQPCPDNTTARGTGIWSEVQFSFHKDGKLYLAINKSASIPTPSGAYLGTGLDQLKKIYGGVPGQELNAGGKTAYLVNTLNGRGVLFELDQTTKKVVSMMASDGNFLRLQFQGNGSYC